MHTAHTILSLIVFLIAQVAASDLHLLAPERVYSHKNFLVTVEDNVGITIHGTYQVTNFTLYATYGSSPNSAGMYTYNTSTTVPLPGPSTFDFSLSEVGWSRIYGVSDPVNLDEITNGDDISLKFVSVHVIPDPSASTSSSDSTLQSSSTLVSDTSTTSPTLTEQSVPTASSSSSSSKDFESSSAPGLPLKGIIPLVCGLVLALLVIAWLVWRHYRNRKALDRTLSAIDTDSEVASLPGSPPSPFTATSPMMSPGGQSDLYSWSDRSQDTHTLLNALAFKKRPLAASFNHTDSVPEPPPTYSRLPHAPMEMHELSFSKDSNYRGVFTGSQSNTGIQGRNERMLYVQNAGAPSLLSAFGMTTAAGGSQEEGAVGRRKHLSV